MWKTEIAALLFLTATACHGAPVPRSTDVEPQLELPLLVGKRLVGDLARVGSDGSVPTTHTWEVPAPQLPPAGPGFVDDSAALAAVRAWLAQHYFVDDAADAQQVQLIAYDRQRNRATWRQFFGDLPTDVRGGITFAGTTPVSAMFAPVALTEVAGSRRPIVTAAQATAAWRTAAQNRGLDLAQVAAREHTELLPEPVLRYVKSLRAADGATAGAEQWRPAWLLDEVPVLVAGKLGVDAQTGTPWLEFDTQELSTKPVAAFDIDAMLLGPPMPLLRCTPIPPIASIDLFAEEYGGYRFPAVRTTPKPATEPAYASDALAVAAGEQWLVRHFGPMPDRLSLRAIRYVIPDNPDGSFATEDGHALTFRLCYDDIPTDLVTTVDLIGKTVARASPDLRTLLPIADSTKPTLTREGAIAAVLHALEVDGAPAEVIARWRDQMDPTLEYVRSGRVDLDFTILVPNWSIAPHSTIFVDAHTGKVWRND